MDLDDECLLAVDVGMKAGLAWFRHDGTLLRARTTHFANRTVLRKALPSIWAELPGLYRIILEGTGELTEIWRKGAIKAGIKVETTVAEEWRKEMLLTSQMRSGKQAKAVAGTKAAIFAKASEHSPKTTLGDDAAEAVMFGIWYMKRIGWIE